jgi:hypothetical protein
VLPADAVSEALLSCRVGACFHPPALLGKSTVYAAYCAHGVAPLVLSPVPEAPDLAGGVHYWRPGLPFDGLPDVAAAASEWYRGHALAIQAARYAELLAP